jgi:EAL domain-containing protein (putative c-di-GMP-specific phosphodiesterase class I)
MVNDTLIKNILKERNIITLFQPVVSLRNKRIVGYEALSRGICSSTGKIISPLDLFSMAREEECDIELDRLCRKTALKSFKTIPDYEKYILFLNLDTSILDRCCTDTTKSTKEFTDEVGLDYSSISLEIVESKIENNQKLAKFVDNYRKLGYYVSLDDFGAMHSNMNRIILSKPDIIKIDMGLIRNVYDNYYQQSIITSIIDIARKTGALTLAEGLENMDDIMKSYELGIDLYQGFFFYRPCVDVAGNIPFIEQKIEYVVHYIKNKLKENVIARKHKHSNFDFIVNMLKKGSNSMSYEDFYVKLKKSINQFNEIERIFILNSNGQQISPSVINTTHKTKRLKSFCMFHENQSDHSLKEYFYYLYKLDTNKFFTDTFISATTGNVLRTMSSKITIGNEEHVICVDFVDSYAAVESSIKEAVGAE